MEKTLVMTFKTAGGKDKNLRLKNPKASLDEGTVRSAMDAIAETEAFFEKDATVSTEKARILTVEEEELF